jgi:hypothetical protein
MNAQQRRIATRALPKQGALVKYNGKNGIVDVRVAGPLLSKAGRTNSVYRVKVTNPATRGRSTPLLSQLVF